MSSQDTTDNVAAVNSPSISSRTKNWVQFEDETPVKDNGNVEEKTKTSAPAVIKPESVTVNVEKIGKTADKSDNQQTKNNEYRGAVIPTESVQINLDRSGLSRSMTSESPDLNVPSEVRTSNPKSASLKTIDLRDVSNGRSATSNIISTPIGNIRQGFANGDTIVTLLPVNTKWPWITPAKFRPELVPEELMAQGLTLTVEDYVHIMELLVNDVRFNMYNVCYKRILVLWIFTAFIVLLGLLFSGVTGLTLFGLGVMWLVLNAAAIFFCMFIKIKLNHNLEKCMAQVNKHLLRHKILLGLDDRGKISCHKVNLCFIYFDTTDCIKKLQEVIEREEREGRVIGEDGNSEMRRKRELQQRMDIDDSDIVIQGSTTTRISRKQSPLYTGVINMPPKRSRAPKANSSEAKDEKKNEKKKTEETKSKKTKRVRDEAEEPKSKRAKTEPKQMMNKTDTDLNEIDFDCEKLNAEGKKYNLKISSWNVSGIRALIKKNGIDYITKEDADIVALQETKCDKHKLPEEIKLDGYHHYFLDSKKPGYCGVALYSKEKPIDLKYGINDPEFDDEGRIITAEYPKFYLINVYVPNAGQKLVTLPKKLQWNEVFKAYVKKLDEKKPVIICGDMNVAHQEIDLTNPKTNTKNAGFTKEEREGMTDFLASGFVDTFRALYPEKTGAYTFWSYFANARSKNIGWRLDYYLVSERIKDKVCDNVMRDKVYGSDHCPIVLYINI
ncbi:uncharacterized protein LOC143187409 isoform X1 [Calliopsis andreniformis]|uniref:uncharacterized protein LOC143187409 isoform X1 n=1 Tax=Calliopsis andreniformis TaxID=337506 RepID=UPI003FCD18F8